MSYPESSRLADPAFRRERARNAASSRTTVAHYVSHIVARAAELTDEHRIALRRALRQPHPACGREHVDA